MNPIYPRIFITLSTLLAFAITSGCKSDHSSPPATTESLPSVKVETIIAELTIPARQVEVMGTVQAADRALIAAKISGNITEILVNPGSRVKQGDLLASISAGEISAKLLQVQAQLEQATRNLAREQSLLKKNAATVETVKTLEESKKIAEAAYKEARTVLSYTSIRAPFDGIITKKFSSTGDLATPGSPLLQLENEAELEVITDIPESLVLGISLGDQLPVFIPAADLTIVGIVREIAPTADPQSRTAPVKLTIDSKTKIRSGQFARVSLPGTKGEAFLLPTTAIHPFGQMERVFIVENQTAQLKLVKTGLKHDSLVEILSGIQAGDEIIVSGGNSLKDGQPVTLQ